MDKSKIGLKGAMAIGIGGMVGGGIFAVLGLAVSLGKGGTPVSLLNLFIKNGANHCNNWYGYAYWMYQTCM